MVTPENAVHFSYQMNNTHECDVRVFACLLALIRVRGCADAFAANVSNKSIIIIIGTLVMNNDELFFNNIKPTFKRW